MSARSRLLRVLGAHDGRPVKHGLVAGLVATIILASAGGSYAYWTTSASVASTPRAATLVVTASAVSLNATYGNDTLTSTSYVSVTNNTTTASTTVPGLSIALTSQTGGDATLAGNTTIQTWLVANAASCTTATAVPTSGVVSGTWNAGVNVTGLSVAKTATTTICIRSTVSDRTAVASASGSRTFTPVATATINVSNFTAATSASGTQSTQYIFAPVTIERQNWYFIKVQGQTNCLDVSGGAIPATSGTTFISYPCKSAADTSNFIWNQQWTFLATDSGYAEIKPRSGTTLRVDTGATTGASLQLTTAAAAVGADDSQEWMVQSAGSGMYQFVNRVNGLCMTSQAGAADMGLAACSAATTQRFTIESPKPILLDNVTCAITGTGTGRVMTYSYYQNDNGAYQLQYQASTNAAWTTLTTTGARSGSVAATVGSLNASAFGTTYPTRIVDTFGTVVDTGSLVARSLTAWTCT